MVEIKYTDISCVNLRFAAIIILKKIYFHIGPTELGNVFPKCS